MDLSNESTPKFRNLTLFEKRKVLADKIDYSQSTLTEVLKNGGIGDDQAELMVENCIG